MHVSRRLTPSLKRRQLAVAAVEFALVLTLMVLLLCGLAVYWQILQAQQSVARATGDGARMLQELVQGSDPRFNMNQSQGKALIEQKVTLTVQHSLKGTGLPAVDQTNVNIRWRSNSALLEVSYPNTPVLGLFLIPSIGALTASSVIALEPSS